MKRRLLFCFSAIIFLLHFTTTSRATHIMGGSLSYEYEGLDTVSGNYYYKITLELFRLCDAGSSLLPIDMNLGVYQDDPGNPGGDKLLVLNTTLPLIIQQGITPPNANDSCTFAPNVCVEEGVYQAIIAVPPNSTGYYFISDRCCRNNNIINLNNPGNDGEAYFAFAPQPTIVNSSPTFAVAPVPFICNTDTVSVLNQAFDPDGDLLVYNFVTPYNGISDGGNPNPNPPAVYPWPIPLVTYNATYSVASPFGPGGYAVMNSSTGLASYYSPNQGFYVLAVEIEEYRNGVLIGISRRDIQIIVIPCPINPAPVLSSTTSQTSFTIDEGDTLCFNTTFNDPNGDSIFISHNGTIFGAPTNPVATFIDSSGAGQATGQFCWITDCSQGSTVPYQFSVIATDNGCPAKITNLVYTINVTNTPKPPMPTGPDSLCYVPGAVYVLWVPALSGYTHTWNISNGAFIGSNNGDSVTVSFAGPGSAILTVASVNHNGCLSDTTMKKVHLTAIPVSIAGPDVSFCSGDSATLGTTAIGGLTYSWVPSTGLSSSTSANPTVILTNSGTSPTTTNYIVTTSDGGCSSTDTVQVTVNPIPAPSAGPDVAICSGNSASIGTTNVPGSTYSWSPSTGLSSTSVSNPTVTLTNTSGGPITQQYIVNVQNSFGCSSTDTVNVTVNIVPVATAGNDTSFCSGSSVSIGTSSVPGYSYSWNPALGLSSSSASNPVLTLTNSTGVDDTVYYVVTTTLGSCSTQDTVQVIVKVSPISDAGPDQSLCSGGTIQLGASSTSGYNYTWTPGTGLSSTTISNPTATLTNAGSTPITQTYTVITDLNGCITSDSVTITINPVPVAIAGPDTAYCSGNSVTIGSASLPNYTYNWTPTNGLSSSTISNPTVTLTNSTGSPITVAYVLTTDLFTCLATDTVLVTVNPSPVSNAGPDQLLCSGGTIQLGTASTTGYTYSWSPTTGLSSTTISNPTLTLTNTGSTPVTVTYIVTTNLNGCITTDTVQITSSPAATAQAGADTSYCSGNSVTIGSASQPNYTYNWTPANGLSSSTVSNPTVTLTNGTGSPIIVTYVLNTDLFGCTAIDSVQVTVNPSPVSNAGQDATICGNDTITLGTSSTAGYVYNWTPTTGLSSTTISNPQLTINNVGTSQTVITYVVTTNLNGCITSDSVTITVNPQPAVSASANPNSICTGGSSILTATGAIGYSWAVSTSPGTSISTDSVFTVNPANTTTYILTGTNSSNCSNTATVTVTVNPLPQVQISAANDTICNGDTLTLNVTGASNYTWSILGGSTIGSGSTILVNPSANTTYVVVGTDANSCSNSDTISIFVNPAATITGITGTVSVCPGVTGVQYWVLNPDPNSTYTWVVTNGTIVSGQGTDTITVDWSTTPGTGTVTIEEITNLGCHSLPIILSVNINVLLTPVAPTGPITMCANEAQGIIYTLLNTPGSTYNWFAQGGVIVSGNGTSTVTVNWTTPGPATVLLWYQETSITNVDTCFGVSDTLAINLNPAPSTSAISGPADVCINNNGSFSVINTTGSTYNWFITGGTILSGGNSNSITASWSGSGTATVSVVETNSFGCIGDTVTYNITVHALPPANAGQDVSVCTGQGVQLNASGGVSYSWSPSTGLSNTGIFNPVASPTVATTYIVLVTDVFGCQNSDSIVVSVNGLPNITITPNSDICIGGTIQLNAGGGTAYQWSPTSTLNNSGISNPVANPTSTTTYTVVVTDQNTCVDSAQVTITVNPLPIITAGNDTIICEGTSASLSANGGVSYNWSPASSLNNSNIANPLATPSSPTTYTVTGTDVHGCSNTAQMTVSLNVRPKASFTIQDGTDALLSCDGYKGNLTNTSVDALTYLWLLSSGATTTVENPSVQLNLTGNNTITLIATNNMCSDTAVHDFMSTAVDQLFEHIPNVFTPNGDRINDCFDLGTQLDLSRCSSWEVFDRWGKKVFTSSPAHPCWGGKIDGDGLSVVEGTYYLIVVIGDKSYKGSITVIK